MSHWNHRILAKAVEAPYAKAGATVEFSLIEVYYDDDHKITGWCPAPAPEADDSITDLRSQIVIQLRAFEKPTLGINDLPAGETVG